MYYTCFNVIIVKYNQFRATVATIPNNREVVLMSNEIYNVIMCIFAALTFIVLLIDKIKKQQPSSANLGYYFLIKYLIQWYQLPKTDCIRA